MDFEIENELRPNLSSGERLLWTGRPKTGILLRPGDRYMIPFSLFWASFAFFWEFMAIKMGAPFFFMLFGIPFILIGIYMVAGRFLVDARIRKNIRYGITPNHIIIQSGLSGKHVRSINIRTLDDISFTEKPDGSGTILLGSEEPANTPGRNISRKNVPSLEFIPDVKRVYNIIIKQQAAP